MDVVVAIEVKDSKANVHYFITWGRIFDRVNPNGLESIIAKHAPMFGIKKPRFAAVCDSLQSASKAQHFYEALMHFSQERIPSGKRTYSSWREKMKGQMLSGKQLFYCGVGKKNSK
jgi:hypothetical protein